MKSNQCILKLVFIVFIGVHLCLLVFLFIFYPFNLFNPHSYF